MTDADSQLHEPSQDPVVARLRDLLQALECLQTTDRIQERLAPFQVDSVRGDSVNCALARYLQWGLSLPNAVRVDRRYVQIAGHPWVELPPNTAAFQGQDSAGPSSPASSIDSIELVDHLRIALEELSALGSREAISNQLQPWRCDPQSGAIDGRDLARYLQWKIASPSEISLDNQYAKISGHPWVAIPPQVAAYVRESRASGALAPSASHVPLISQDYNAEEFKRRIEASKRADASTTLIWTGLLLAIAGAIALLVPFMNLGAGVDASTISLSTANGLCSSSFGALAQGFSAQVSQDCGNIALGFFGSWGAIVLGGGLALTGVLRR